MALRAILIPAADTDLMREVEWHPGVQIGEEGSAQKLVGGFVEEVHLDTPGVMLLVNEEGFLRRLAANLRATILAHRVLVGDVLVVGRSETMELPDDVTVEYITSILDKKWRNLE